MTVAMVWEPNVLMLDNPEAPGFNGKENGNYYNIIGYILGLYRGYLGIREKKMETWFWSLGSFVVLELWAFYGFWVPGCRQRCVTFARSWG